MNLRRALRRHRAPAHDAAWAVIGLGNPGEAYARNRHNAGVWTVNELARRSGAALRAEGRSIRIAVAGLAGERVALVRPRVYVNESGRAAAQALRASGAPVERLIVVYDELDLPAGALRLRQGGGAGGHNGLRSIIAETGEAFARVRLGIGRPLEGGEPTRDPDVVASYVLSDPAGAERETLEATARLAADAVIAIVAEGLDAAGTRFNRRGPGGASDGERRGV